MTSLMLLARRFAGPVFAAYLLHWGIWSLLLVITHAVLVVLAKTLYWVTLGMFGSFHILEEELMPALRFLPAEIAQAMIPIILGLLVAWWVLYRKRRAPEI
jgi:hypothetical protein